jgi:hypothetical protein
MARRKAWVWHGLDDDERVDIRQGSGGGWQHAPPDDEPPVIHLPDGTTHAIRPPARERLGFKKE